jgi:hypothetical protein
MSLQLATSVLRSAIGRHGPPSTVVVRGDSSDQGEVDTRVGCSCGLCGLLVSSGRRAPSVSASTAVV